MKEIKVEAKTIQDAVEKGLTEIGLRRDQVEVVVVSEGSKGILGFGVKKACVCLREKKWTGGAPEAEERRPERAAHGRGRRNDGHRHEGGPRREHSRRGGFRPDYQRVDRQSFPNAAAKGPGPASGQTPESRPAAMQYQARRPEPVYTEIALPAEPAGAKAPEDPLEHAKTALARILGLMGIQASITDAKHDAQEGLISLKFESGESAAFTDENARGLQSLQFLVNSMINRSRHGRIAVRIDTCDYWKLKEAELLKKVESAAKSVQETARPYRLEPMPASLRKFVHGLVKASYPGVETFSEGEGRWRKVVIKPLSKKEEPAK
ncbi:MAG: Jag N-terminal domain-containing protein [Elusimicrobia bacterium]|nr:Jag N-terminal domain-containing protein [Elusimicrobiota bacterium]